MLYVRTFLRRTTQLSPAVCLLLCGHVQAANFDYEASLSAGRSSNIARTAENEIEEDIVATGLQFSFDERTSKLRADMVGNLLYYDYLDDTYDSELLGNFSGDARLALVPERFEWILTDYFGQVLNDPFEPATPENRENINYLLTGPDATLGLGSQLRLRVGARYGMTSYEDSPFDSDSVSGQLGLEHLLSSAGSVSLNARVQRVEHDETTLEADYDQKDAYLAYSAAGARTRLTLDVGYTELEREVATEQEGGLLLRLDLSRRLSASSVALLTAGREFSSAGQAFASAQSTAGAGLGAVPGRQTVQPFLNDHASIGYVFSRQRAGISVTGTWSDQTYEDQPLLDQTLTTLATSVRRELSSRTALTLDADYLRGDFEQAADYSDVHAGLTFEWRVSQHVAIGLTYDHFDRSSDLSAGDYTENRYWLSIGYARGVPRQTLLLPEFAIDAALPGT